MTKIGNVTKMTLALIVATSVMVTGAIAQTVMVPEPPTINSNNVETVDIQYLTEEEKTRTMNIINNDPQANSILDKGNWYVKHIGPRTLDGEKYGSLVFIKFEEPIWVEDTLTNPFSKESYSVQTWTKSMHIAADFDTNKVSGIDLGMTRPTTESSIADSKIASAEMVAKENQSLDGKTESRLVAVYETNDFPEGIAFFSVMSADGKNEEMIAVNLETMRIEEKFSGIVWRISS